MAKKRLLLRLLGLKEGEQVNVSVHFFTCGELRLEHIVMTDFYFSVYQI